MAKPTAAEKQAEKRRAEEKANATQAKKKLSDSNFDLTAALSPAGPNMTTIAETVVSEAVDIKSLQAGNTNKNVKGKIVNKSFRRDYGKGNVFSFDLMDKTSTIRVNVFSSIPEFEDIYMLIEVNAIIQLSAFRVGPKNANYNKLEHACEITWIATTTAEEIDSEELQALAIEFDFVKLKDALNRPAGSTIDAIGILTDIGCIKETGHGQLRILTMVDDSQCKLQIHLWKGSSTVEPDRGSVVALKRAQIKETTFMNVTSRHLTVNTETLFWMDPELDRATELVSWMNSELAQK